MSETENVTVQNSLLPLLLEVILEHTKGLSEFEMIKALESKGVSWPFSNETADLVLFHKHFMVMNGLYHLQTQFLEENLYLSISPLTIILLPLSSTQRHSTTSVAKNSCAACAYLEEKRLSSNSTESRLRDYYSDWNNLKSMTAASVQSLLNGFWERFAQEDKFSDALLVLGIKPLKNGSLSWPTVEKKYRQLASQHHPDRGGDKETFIRIRQAYEVLKLSRSD